MPPLEARVKRDERKTAVSARALADLDTWIADVAMVAR
jgi:hypothetical protein